MIRYAVELRSLTQGTGTFTRSPARYEPMPDQLAATMIRDRAS
jgi:elongation factor G